MTLAARSNTLPLAAAGMSRLKCPSRSTVRSEPTYVGCYFLNGLLGRLRAPSSSFGPGSGAAKLAFSFICRSNMCVSNPFDDSHGAQTFGLLRGLPGTGSMGWPQHRQIIGFMS